MKYKTVAFCVIGVFVIACGVLVFQRVKLLHVLQAHFGSGDQCRMVYAAFTGDKKGLEKYLSQGVPIDCRTTDAAGFTPLKLAVGARNKKAVWLLLEYGADPNATDDKGRASLHEAVISARNKNDTWFLDILLKHGARPDPEMYYAIITRSLPMVEHLIEAGADVNARDPVGETPLVYAMRGNEFEIAYYLLQKGADPKIDEHEQNLMLGYIQNDLTYHAPSVDYRPKVIDWLKEHGAWKDNVQVWRENQDLWKQKQAQKNDENAQTGTQ